MMLMIVELEKNKFAFGFHLYAAGLFCFFFNFFFLACLFSGFCFIEVFPPKKLGIDISLIDLFFNFL